jgi:hypothetical protein
VGGVTTKPTAARAQWPARRQQERKGAEKEQLEKDERKQRGVGSRASSQKAGQGPAAQHQAGAQGATPARGGSLPQPTHTRTEKGPQQGPAEPIHPGTHPATPRLHSGTLSGSLGSVQHGQRSRTVWPITCTKVGTGRHAVQEPLAVQHSGSQGTEACTCRHSRGRVEQGQQHHAHRRQGRHSHHLDHI